MFFFNNCCNRCNKCGCEREQNNRCGEQYYGDKCGGGDMNYGNNKCGCERRCGDDHGGYRKNDKCVYVQCECRQCCRMQNRERQGSCGCNGHRQQYDGYDY